MRTLRHLSLSIEGALRRPQDWVGEITVDGRRLTTKAEVTAFFKGELAKGHKLLPFTECEGFDFVTGCPGHRYEDKEEST